MSLLTDIIFVKALRSNTALMGELPAGDVYNTTIPIPDEELENAPIPYIIVSYDGMQNEGQTKDNPFEGDTDRVTISVIIVAKTRPQLGELATSVRQTIREYFDGATELDEDEDLVPFDYALSAQGVIYDPNKPSYSQVLSYQCDTNID